MGTVGLVFTANAVDAKGIALLLLLIETSDCIQNIVHELGNRFRFVTEHFISHIAMKLGQMGANESSI